ncbi:hypothetical protein [Flavobacterium sp. GCM10027622]|uniref:hypothetical protein n=1 Tax=unclassified Flavobacterium TaxID=196869 RepID=UPI003610332A
MTLNLKIVALVFFVMFSNMMLKAQEKGINMKNKENGKTVFLKENKRVAVKTDSGKVFKGRFKIVDDKSIAIRKDTIALTSIVKIKRRPVGLSIASGLLVAGIGTPVTIVSIAYGGYAVLLVPVGVAIDGVGLALPAFGRRYKENNWDYVISK